jgi:hypothetical protein
MNSAYIKYLRRLLIFSGILGLMTLIISFILPKTYLSPALPFLFVFFIATSLLSFYYLLRSADKRFIKFVNTFLLTIIIKLLIYTGIIIAYVFANRGDAIPFTLGFFVLYLCYTIFEAVSIISTTHPSGPVNKVQ